MTNANMLREIISFFAKFIESEVGIVYSEENFYQLQNRLEEIARQAGMKDIESFYESVKKTGLTGSLKQLLIDKATNNETLFFRDTRCFEAIEALMRTMLPVAAKQGRPLRVWSAACSTGKEALSLAMIYETLAAKGIENAGLSILATDISTKVLEKARSGTYTNLEISRGLSQEQKAQFFKNVNDDQWVASPELMRHIAFRELNLKSDFSFPDKFDLVLCRNVLIYQRTEVRVQIFKRIAASLVDRGYLILGSGESLIGLSKDFDQESLCGAILYRRS